MLASLSPPPPYNVGFDMHFTKLSPNQFISFQVAVQTPGFSPPAPAKQAPAPWKKTPAEDFQLRQIVKIRNLMEISRFKVKELSLFLILHEHFVLCLWQAYAVSMRVFTFSSMDSGFFADK